jgi:hypothetical protein
MKEHVVIDAAEQVMRCNVCGDTMPIPLGCVQDWVTPVMKAFARAHESASHAGGRTMMSVPKDAMRMLAPLALSAAQNEMQEKITRWICHGETGMSSMAMAAAVVSAPGRSDHPSDPDDLHRCLLFLNAVPEARQHMEKVGALSKQWRALVDIWPALEECFICECGLHGERGLSAKKTYEMMKGVLK